MKFKIIIPARKNSKRLPGKNMKILRGKPLIQYSIDYALNFFSNKDIWVNSDDQEVLTFAKTKGVMSFFRPEELATDFTTTVDVLKHQVNYFKKKNIACDSIILLQPTNPLREDTLLKEALKCFQKSNRNSLATFSVLEKKIGEIENFFFKPTNYIPGQRSQDLQKTYHENGSLYITKVKSILNGKIVTDDVYPLILNNIGSSVDIDYLEDFIFAESILKLKI